MLQVIGGINDPIVVMDGLAEGILQKVDFIYPTPRLSEAWEMDLRDIYSLHTSGHKETAYKRWAEVMIILDEFN